MLKSYFKFLFFVFLVVCMLGLTFSGVYMILTKGAWLTGACCFWVALTIMFTLGKIFEG